ncbi:MAG: YegS/Rv2252/BmrU family lipid kinase [Cyanosarcina radialis HA8281-LM2]|jgi:YegS/Rv2252/BmrU family lipid kinase|nr:YegS/Rv2252/BmrU family lipid kinase [Cyanosarcina radialis HA8281-LM2]
MSSRSACLIFNPVAGQGNPEQDLATIRAILEPEIALDTYLTTEEVDAGQLATVAIQRGAEAILVAGGDGTLSAAAVASIGTGIPLGIISRGTANAFATALDLPVAIDVACQTILAGYTRQVDAAYCNGQPLVLLAGIGFEAETVELTDRASKDRWGMLAYILSGIKQLTNLKDFEVEIETEDRKIAVSASAITVANAAPPTSILAQGPAGVIANDGLLDLTIVAPANFTGAIAASYDLLRTALQGEATTRPDVGYLRSRYFKIDTDPPQKVVIDGEVVGSTPIEVECIPNGLTIYAPQVEPTQPLEKLEGLPNLSIEFKDESEPERN